jgi:glucokinase
MELNGHTISIDLGGTKCSAALVSWQGELTQYQSVELAGARGTAVGELVLEKIEELLAHAALKHRDVAGIGISVPGISDRQRQTVWAPNIEGWEKFPLQPYLQDHLTRHDLPILIESDRGCSVLGEHWLGIAQGVKDVIFLSVGTGIGAGIMADGKLIRGSHDIAGAIGWMALQRPFDNKFKSCGNFEYYASGEGLVRAANEMITEHAARLFPRRAVRGMKAEELFESLKKNDQVALKVIEQAVELWGMACANLVSLFNPEIIVFGGGVFGPAVQFLERIYREAIRWAQPVAMRQVRFVETALKGNAPLLGAAYNVFSKEKGTSTE